MRGVRKADLPTKDCATCGRPFTWRKRWARAWDEVRHCSDACRARRPRAHAAAPATTAAPSGGVAADRRRRANHVRTRS